MFAFMYAFDLSESLSSLLSLCIYVAMSYGTYTMVKRCGLRRAWMAWVPLLRLYKLGEIADLHCRRNEGRQTNLRKILVILSLLTSTVAIFALLHAIMVLFAVIIAGMAGGPGTAMNWTSLFTSTWILWLVGAALAVALVVLLVVAMHRISKLFAPENATLYTVLSAFLLPIPVVLVLLAQKEPIFTDGEPFAPGWSEDPQPHEQVSP